MPTVKEIIRDDRANCSTARVKQLSLQVIAVMNRLIEEEVLVPIDDLDISSNSDTVNLFLQPKAKEALARAIQARGARLRINSCFRTVVQQHILFSWQGSSCVSIAAQPGKSNHEDGFAIDIPDFDQWKKALEDNEWDWFGPGDDVHFTYVGGDVRDDIGFLGVKAFQTLWNRHNPQDQIEADGIYGQETAARLDRSPATGFPESGAEISPPAGRTEGDRTIPAARILKLQPPPLDLLEGADVREIQEALVKLSLLSAGEESVYGPATATAVEVFQKREGLAVDGQVGPNTRKALLKPLQVPLSTPPGLSAPVDSLERVELKRNDGMDDLMHLIDEVEDLQTTLRNWGVFPIDAAIDGEFGTITEAAVQSFQRLRPADPERSSFVPSGLAITGVVDRDTWAELLKVRPEAIKMISREAGSPPLMPNSFPDINVILAKAQTPAAILPFAEQNLPLIVTRCLSEGITNRKQIAYVLATAEHESLFGKLMIELASGEAYEGRLDLGNTQLRDGPRYKGRGFVQITGRGNYKIWGDRLQVDLIGNPGMAARPEIAVAILVQGMRDGSYTGLKLDDFIGNDFVQARRIVNGLDRAQQIARIADSYLDAIT
jgi:peptidoglycan hydrolase-like protein with peptidoglycan-binding domain/predicted chitinase